MADELAEDTIPVLAGHADFLIATAARAPSVHNTQPWRFRFAGDAVELYADPGRKLRTDPLGRLMLISCGAALFGLRLGIRSLGYLPAVDLLPDPAQLKLLARVRLGQPAPMTSIENEMLDALPHRHTHRGPFTADPLPPGLVASLQHDAVAEHATLALVDRPHDYQVLARIVADAGRRMDLDPVARDEIMRWSRGADSAQDGIPAHAFSARPGGVPGRLPQRDFDLGRGLGTLPGELTPPAVTAVLLTTADRRADWLRAGQALHRLLARAASRWVFASLHTQPLEAAAIRALVRTRLALPGAPQLVLQLGPASATRATARRPPADLIE